MKTYTQFPQGQKLQGRPMKYLHAESSPGERVVQEEESAEENVDHLLYLYVFICINAFSFVVGFIAGFMVRWITL